MCKYVVFVVLILVLSLFKSVVSNAQFIFLNKRWSLLNLMLASYFHHPIQFIWSLLPFRPFAIVALRRRRSERGCCYMLAKASLIFTWFLTDITSMFVFVSRLNMVFNFFGSWWCSSRLNFCLLSLRIMSTG